MFGLKAITGAVASSSALDRVGFFSHSDNILVDGFNTKQQTATFDSWILMSIPLAAH